jgi:hypothetical protein
MPGFDEDAVEGTQAPSQGRGIMTEENVCREEFRVSGERMVGKVKELVHEGNIRRVIIKDAEGKTLIEVPLTIGVVGAVLLPVWAALGAIAALAAELTIVIERVEDQPGGQEPQG